MKRFMGLMAHHGLSLGQVPDPKRGLKLHTVLTGLLPQCILVTDCKTHDCRAVQALHFETNDLLIFDRAYLDYACFTGCTKAASGL